jgi:hypothetical protein
MQELIKLLPRISGTLQLVGFLFAALCYALIYRVDPDNIASLATTGIFGVALVTIPLAFRPQVLRYVTEHHRAWFMLSLVALLLVSFGALAVVTIRTISTPSPQGARFDSTLLTENVRVIRHSNGTDPARVELTWKLWPLSSKEDQGATVFLGLVSIHDEDEIANAGPGKITTLSCNEVSSCLGHHIFEDLAVRPVLVRSGTPGTTLTTVVDLRRLPENVRVWWEFYQLEGLNGDTCGIDHSRPAPAEGLPPLAMFRGQQRVGDLCYRSYDQRTLTLGQSKETS